MDEDDRLGGTGEWVGLMGFSQGAKVSASLLYEQQVQTAAAASGSNLPKPNWRFAVLLAGRAPLVSLSPASAGCKALVDAAAISEGFQDVEPDAWDGYEKLNLPTIHVHGTKDPGIHLHRRLLNQYCDAESTRVIEWEGEHRVPIKSKDVGKIVDAIFEVAKKTGVMV
jgi:dienelactone hydrolase